MKTLYDFISTFSDPLNPKHGHISAVEFVKNKYQNWIIRGSREPDLSRCIISSYGTNAPFNGWYKVKVPFSDHAAVTYYSDREAIRYYVARAREVAIGPMGVETYKILGVETYKISNSSLKFEWFAYQTVYFYQEADAVEFRMWIIGR